MIRNFLIIAFSLIWTFTCKAQKDALKSYNCVFIDTLTFPLSDETYKNMAADIVRNNGLPDSLIQNLAKELRFSTIMTLPMQVQTRNVTATADSTVVLMSSVVHKGLEMPLSYKKMVIEKGRKITSMVSEDHTQMDIPSFTNRNFIATTKTKIILGFKCNEYTSDGGAISIWVTDALPSTINPGISNVNVQGGILGFTIRKEYQILSVLKSIK
jgi:hypothetical protein